MIKMTLLPSSAVASPPLSQTILLLFFFFFFSGSTLVSAAGDLCPPSSCGNLTNIGYPYRLKDDPPNCGDSNFELTCDHLMNYTILTLFSHTYYVTNITYNDYDHYYYANYVEFKIQVKDAGMEKYNNKGSCSHILPLLIPSPLTYSKLKSNKYYEASESWVTLVNCSKEVKNMSIYDDEYYYNYRPVPCLSHNNNSFIYLIESENVGGLMPSCRFLAMFPINNNLYWNWSSDQPVKDIFRFLAQGFTLSGKLSGSTTIRNCLRNSIREIYQYITDHNNSIKEKIEVIVFGIEPHFLGCIHVYNHNRKHYNLVIRIIYIVVILLQMAKALPVLAVLGRCVFAPLTIYAFLSYKLHQMMSSIDIVEKFLRNQQTLVPTRYSYTDIISMTSNFKEKLGQGGFGSVFKGRLPWDRLVAIKMLTNSKCNTGEDC